MTTANQGKFGPCSVPGLLMHAGSRSAASTSRSRSCIDVWRKSVFATRGNKRPKPPAVSSQRVSEMLSSSNARRSDSTWPSGTRLSAMWSRSCSRWTGTAGTSSMRAGVASGATRVRPAGPVQLSALGVFTWLTLVAGLGRWSSTSCMSIAASQTARRTHSGNSALPGAGPNSSIFP